MVYTTKNAIPIIEQYLNNINATKKIIDNTKNRGWLVNIGNAPGIVVFVSPIVHKLDETKNYFDTRDSSPDAREAAWKYAKDNNYKYFFIGINDSVPKYEHYIFSVEADEKLIEELSGTKNGMRVGKGNQIIIPNDYVPNKNFDRIKNKLNVYISVIHKDFLKEYLTVFDNRPYAENTKTDNEEISDIDFVFFSSNLLLYGVPGCGKSYYVEENYEKQISNDQCKIRVVFHPDYTYSDFVGQIMPVIEKVDKDGTDGEQEEKLKYKFVPGPFTRILQVANENKNEKCLLIIEELNRGNAPAIFGEVFQLLDRDSDGSSKYAIYNSDIANEVYDDEKHPVKLPPNLTIVATMNTSDQNVFTMDTAFQRRWQMKHIPNRFTGDSLSEAVRKHVAKAVPGSQISWGAFAPIVNSKMGKAMLGMAGTDDKSLGVYFATDNDLDDKDIFAEKVLKYLWDDAFRLARSELFKDYDRSLAYVIEAFEAATGDPLQSVLQEAVYKEMQAEQEKFVMVDEDNSSAGDDSNKDSSVDTE